MPGRKPRQIGKAFEYQVAKRLGGQRSGYGNASTEPDVVSEAFDVECKVTPLPAMLEKGLSAVRSRGNPKKMQIVVLKEKGHSWEDARVYMSFAQFCDWHA